MRLIPIVLCAAVALTLIGCKPQESANSNSAKPSADLRFSISGEHNTLDPQKMSWLHDLRIAECLFEPLVRYKLPEVTIEPAAAASWDVSPDGLTYTFHLRPEAQWSNGDPVVARDFIYAWRRSLLPDSAGKYTKFFFNIHGAKDFFKRRSDALSDYVKPGEHTLAKAKALLDKTYDDFAKNVGVSSPDDHTIVLLLERPTPYFLELAAFGCFGPNHAKSVEATETINPDTGMVGVDNTYWSDPARIVTNGPYHLSEREFQRYLRMDANPHFWNRAKMRNGSILEMFIEGTDTTMTSYTRNDINWWPEIPSGSQLAADLIEQNRPDIHNTQSAGTYFYSFNCQPTMPDGSPNPLADARVRKALSLAIDRKALVDQVTRVHQPVARSFVPPGCIPGYEPPVDSGDGLDVEKAKKLLADAGYSDPSKIKGLSILYNTGSAHENIAQVIKAGWSERLGVDVSLEGLELRQFSDRFRNKKYTIARASWFGDYRDPTTFLEKFLTDDAGNDSGWSDAKYDKLLDEAGNTSDPKKRMAILRDAETILLSQAPITCVFHYTNLQMYDAKAIEGMDTNPWLFRRLELVKVNK